ncbi:MAG TPA: hypothetical protein VN317_09380 [Candidatus Methanoperedens sp.]|nr:hypothetical protein [Candidatus Methanoperedens sp.]
MMRSSRHLLRASVAVLCIGASAGCFGAKAPAGPERSPGEVYARVFGANPGLTSLRAVVEARLSYAGRRISLPGVLLLDNLGGFRLELLDPLERVVAMIYSESGRIVQYRPGTGVAASLGVFPAGCRAVTPEDWVGAVLAGSPGAAPAERLTVRRLWNDRLLERWRDGALRQSVRVQEKGGEVLPRLYSWYCGDDAVLQLGVKGSVQAGGRRLPTALTVEYVKAGLSVTLELREVESNPSFAGAPVRPRLAEGTRWTSWRLP